MLGSHLKRRVKLVTGAELAASSSSSQSNLTRAQAENLGSTETKGPQQSFGRLSPHQGFAEGGLEFKWFYICV